MSKQDNLKDYLADLYQGIASKKPGASKNPQDFRREIESIVTGDGSTLPEYDGTVIIEKAESPLGLKKFNDTLTPIVLSETPTSAEYYNANFITITPKGIETGNGSTATYYGFTPFYSVEGVIGAMVDVQIGETRIITDINLNIEFFIGQTFEILSVANDTVAEWVLANTEGVSV